MYNYLQWYWQDSTVHNVFNSLIECTVPIGTSISHGPMCRPPCILYGAKLLRSTIFTDWYSLHLAAHNNR